MIPCFATAPVYTQSLTAMAKIMMADSCLCNSAFSKTQELVPIVITIKWMTYRLLHRPFCFFMPAIYSSNVAADARISTGSKSSMSKLTGSFPYAMVSGCVSNCKHGILRIALHSEASSVHEDPQSITANTSNVNHK